MVMEMTVVVETLLSSWRALLLALVPLHLSEEHTSLIAGRYLLPKDIILPSLVTMCLSQLQLCLERMLYVC